MRRRYLLDTGVAQDFHEDRNGVRDRAITLRKLGHRVGIGHPVLGELWAGYEGGASRDREANRKRLLQAERWFIKWPFSFEAAREYGRLFAELRRRGIVIQQIDLQTAAMARLIPNCVVVSHDTDFQHVPGLDVEDWIGS